MRPDPQRAIASYRKLAAGYDASSRRETPLRLRTIDLLQLARGARVLDVACGTGLSFAPLIERVGARGQVVGVEVSPDMAALALARVAREGWRNVEVRIGDVAAVDLGPVPFDSALFHYTHDVLQAPAALAHLFAALRPGARVAVAGLKTTHPLLFPLNLAAWWRGRRYRTTDANLRTPWIHLMRWVPDFTWQPTYLGTGYIGCGTFRPPSAS
jgi:demethylmenaquinone methyltransferase/2-methoxy-6-polyprenyl-1,4-benzoquinol methylase